MQLNLARIYARLDFLRLMNFKVAWGAEQNQPLNPAHASTIKVFGTEFYLEAIRLMLEILGAAGTFRSGSPDAAHPRPHRLHAARHPHPHLRRRHQRDAARPHRAVRPGHAGAAAILTSSRVLRPSMDRSTSSRQLAT